MITVCVLGFKEDIPIPKEYCCGSGHDYIKHQHSVDYEIPVDEIGHCLIDLDYNDFKFTVSGGN